MKKRTRGLALFLGMLLIVGSVASAGSMAVLAEEPFVSRLTGTDNALIYGAEDMLGDGSRLLKVSSEIVGNNATFTATEEATTYGNHASYVRAYTTPFTPTAGTTVMEFDTASYRAGSKGMYYYIYYGADWDTKTTIKSGSVLGTSAGHVTVVMTTTVKNDGSKVATFQVNGGESSAEIAVGETGRFFLYFDKFYHVPATDTTAAEFSTINISNFHMYHAASTTFAGQKQANGNIAFNQPVASYTATIDGLPATLVKAAETKTSINEYIVDDTSLSVGTHTLQIEATSKSGQTATVTGEIVKEPAFVSRLTGADGALYGADKIIASQTLKNATSATNGNDATYTATSAATSTSSNANYARILLEPFGASEGTTVLEFDTESFRAGGKAAYFYMYYGDKWSGGTRTKIYSGGTMNITKVHWTLIITNSVQEDESTKVNFQLYKDGTAVTLDNNDLAGLTDGKVMLYFDKFYYVAATDETEASASTVTVSNLNLYRPSSGTFKGKAKENGNIAFNLPVETCSATIDGDAASVTKVAETETAINEYTVDAGYLGSGKHTVKVDATAIDGQTTSVTYEIEGVYPEFEAEVMNASGGADAIVSMTFDDGIYDTALFLNEKFKQYGLRGSAMLITSRIENDEYAGTLEEWQALFQQGYLEPESHSYSHYMLPTEAATESNAENEDGTINETKKAQLLAHNTPENYQRELVDSYADVLRLFDHASVGFAPAYNTLSDGAYEVVMDTYYGVRSGSRGIQSLDPQIGRERGQWHNLYMRSCSDAKNNVETLCKQIDQAVEEKGWYISLCHGIYEDSGDLTKANAEILFDHVADLVKEGKVWCTTFGDAIKYVRERQASTLQANSDGETITLNLTRAMTTEDGLDLPADIFDVPLTVKVLLPEGWPGVKVTQNGETTTVDAVINAGVSYAYLDIVPNSGAITLTTAEIVEQPLGEPYLTLEGKSTQKFFAGEYQIHVPVPQRADTTSYAVLGAQYQDGRLIGIKSQTFGIEVIDGDTEMVLDVTVSDAAEQLTCMVWEDMSAMKPVMAKTFEKILPEEDAPYVILKFDDLGTATMTEFQTAVTLCEEQGVVASLGLIGERFTEETDASVYTTIRKWYDDGFEIWHHGFDHATAEYSTCTVEQQKAFFGQTLDLVEEKCGITITAFGSPYNNSTTTTRDMIEAEYPQIQVIMLADYAGTDNITVLDSRVDLETKTGVIASYQTFQNRYAKRGNKDYIVLQGHPSAWSEDSLLNLKLNIQFLKQKGCTFITPTAYVNQ